MASPSPSRIIIDTDPGVDDVLAMMLALAAQPEEVEILLLSVTYGNVTVQSCLKNVVALFHVIEKELGWRRASGQNEGFDTIKSKPIVAVGADHPLEDEILMADFYHGIDGLAGVHESHPHLSPSDAWRSLFQPPKANASAQEVAEARLLAAPSTFFTPTKTPAHLEIVRLLRGNPPDTITIIALGPLTNLALAASEDPETFLRVKEVVVMGGALDVAGNITPVAEFNTYADPVATARVFALTSPKPATTMPPTMPREPSSLPPYPSKLSRQLNLTLFPLDVTTPHVLHRSTLETKLLPLLKAGSPLAEWTYAFLSKTIQKVESLTYKQVDPGVELHDAVCVWYALTQLSPAWMISPRSPEDIRVETAGQWTRGMHLIDRRMRKKMGTSVLAQVRSPGAVEIRNPMEEATEIPNSIDGPKPTGDEEEPASSDHGGWLFVKGGNRINRMVSTPGEDVFGQYLLGRIFG